MNTEQQFALSELFELRAQLEVLAGEARDLVRENFPEELTHCDAFRVFDFGCSSNPHNETFETLLARLDAGEGE
jgi:hypothetical protein